MIFHSIARIQNHCCYVECVKSSKASLQLPETFEICIYDEASGKGVSISFKYLGDLMNTLKSAWRCVFNNNNIY